MVGKGGCRDLSEDAVRGGTGTGYDQCPVRGVGVTDSCICNGNWQCWSIVGGLEPGRQPSGICEQRQNSAHMEP